MAPLTTAHVRTLLAPPATPCVSLYMPTHRGAPDRREEPIRFKNLVRQADEQLRTKFKAAKVQPLIARFDELADDAGFWVDTQDGLAAFAAGDFFAAHRLPRTVPERVVVADSFHIKPLLRVTQSADRFQVLGVTRTETFLFEGNRYGLGRLPTAGLVPTFDAAVGTEVTKPSREKIAVGGRTTSTGHYSSEGGTRKDTLDVDVDRYFRAVDRAVLENVSKRSELPLILACLPQHQTEFRKLSHNPYLIPDGIPTDPGAPQTSPDKLRAEAWKVFEPRYLERLARLTEGYGTAAARGLAASLVADVARAGRDGRIGVLLVDADKAMPGKVDMATGQVRAGSPDDPTTDDLFDDMAELALKTGADVVVVPTDKMPTDTGLAAIFRF
jgi:hypothetical protein